MDASDLARGEVTSLHTTILGQTTEIKELHAADRKRHIMTLEVLRADHRRFTEIRGLRTADRTRQQHLIQTLTVMLSLQRQVTPLQGHVTTLQGQVTILQGQITALQGQTILLGLPEDIYAAVDSCETTQEIWLRVQQMMKGSNIGIQEKKAKLFNEWERFTSNEGKSIESYYHRFLKLMNDLKRNKHFPEKIASNLKFLNNLQPE
nr:hypothetical protein [Tanacetum cinerariifolium]